MTPYLMVLYIATGFSLQPVPPMGFIRSLPLTPQIEIRRGFKTFEDCRHQAQIVEKVRKDVIARCSQDITI